MELCAAPAEVESWSVEVELKTTMGEELMETSKAEEVWAAKILLGAAAEVKP